MTKGLDSVTVDVSSGSVRVGGGGEGGAGARGRGRPRGAATRGARGGAKINRPAAARTIKCDQCKKEFPANVDESVLVHHIKTAHMVKAQETFACDKCEKVLPTATALKYHTCADRFQCNECNKLFLQKSTLIQHQAVAHGPSQESQKEGTKKGEAEKKVEKTKVIGGENEKVKPKPEIVKKIVDDWEDEDEEENEKRRAADEKTAGSESTPSTAVPEGISSEASKEKQEEVDEDQIVADVDDILNDTEDLMGDLDSIASGKTLKRKYSELAKEPPVASAELSKGKTLKRKYSELAKEPPVASA